MGVANPCKFVARRWARFTSWRDSPQRVLNKLRRKQQRRAAKMWLLFTGLFGCAPILLIFVFYLSDGDFKSTIDLFKRGDALLIAVAFYGSAFGELFRLPADKRPDRIAWVVGWGGVGALVAAGNFGHEWTKFEENADYVGTTGLAWISIISLVVSVMAAVYSFWQVAATEWERQELLEGAAR